MSYSYYNGNYHSFKHILNQIVGIILNRAKTKFKVNFISNCMQIIKYIIGDPQLILHFK